MCLTTFFSYAPLAEAMDILVQEMVISMYQDPRLGPWLCLSLAVYVEATKDVTFGVAPLTRGDGSGD